MCTYLGFQPLAQSTPCFLEVIVGLESHPKGFGHSKIARQSKGRVGGYGPLAMNDFIDTTGRNADFPGNTVLTQSHGHQELLEKHLAGVNVLQPVKFGNLNLW